MFISGLAARAHQDSVVNGMCTLLNEEEKPGSMYRVILTMVQDSEQKCRGQWAARASVPERQHIVLKPNVQRTTDQRSSLEPKLELQAYSPVKYVFNTEVALKSPGGTIPSRAIIGLMAVYAECY